MAEGTTVECRRVVHGTGVCDQKCIAGGMDRMVIMQILVLLRSKKWQGLPALCVVLAVMLLGKTTLCHMAEGQLDREYGSGAPYVLWVAMGMQENPDA